MTGFELPGTEVRVVDQNGHDVPRDGETVGEIITRGNIVMKGYWKQPEATAEALRDGWLYTGDLATMDEDGYFSIVDRKKDMIIVSGYNVYPREVEEVLYAHPAIAEAAVIGIAHESHGEEVKAVIALKSGARASADEIIAFCKERLAAYKYPRIVDFVEALPKGPTGKILKRELR
jgi:long-chain acyl-CoA synthetase